MSIVIREATPNDITSIRHMHAASWLATYPNEENDVSHEWLKAETDDWLTPEALNGSQEYFSKVFGNDQHFYRVALEGDQVIGFIHCLVEDGQKELGGFYVVSAYQGTGLAQQLMALADEWFGDESVELGVVAYNTRAIRFYEKNGFREIPDSGGMFKNKIPDLKMRREEK